MHLFLLYSCNYIPRRYADKINRYASEYGVDPAIVFAIAETESHFNPKAKSQVGAIGIMQLMPETAKWVAKTYLSKEVLNDDLFDVDLNIRLGVCYLSYLFSVFDEDWQVFAAYNAGEGTVKAWLDDEIVRKDSIPYPETKAYINKVDRARKRFSNKNFTAFY